MSRVTSSFAALAAAGLMALSPAAQAGAPGEGAIAFSMFHAAAAAPAAAAASASAVATTLQPAPSGPAHDMAQLIAGGIAIVSVGAATIASLRQGRRDRSAAPAAGE